MTCKTLSKPQGVVGLWPKLAGPEVPGTDSHPMCSLNWSGARSGRAGAGMGAHPAAGAFPAGHHCDSGPCSRRKCEEGAARKGWGWGQVCAEQPELAEVPVPVPCRASSVEYRIPAVGLVLAWQPALGNHYDRPPCQGGDKTWWQGHLESDRPGCKASSRCSLAAHSHRQVGDPLGVQMLTGHVGIMSCCKE